MAGEKVKVVGYAQRVFFDNGIEFRNFSDDLVGNQLTSDGGSAIFTSGNFNITSTIDQKPSKIFLTKKYTPFMSLEDLKVDMTMMVQIMTNNGEVRLNLDKSDLCNYAYFGSLVEFIRVSLEDIIITWPASLHINSIDNAVVELTGNTVEDYSYDLVNNKATFKVGVERITNKFNINHKTTGTILNTFNETNDLRNMTVNFTDYVIANDLGDFPIIDFTGNTNDSSDFMFITVTGNPFSTTTSVDSYHIRPSNIKIEEFFNTLPDFEENLLNRFSVPKYKSKYSFNIENENGTILKTEKEVTWPVSDGYNIDFDTTDYVAFATNLLSIGEASDGTKTNLMVRFLTSDSISDFDTIPNCDGEIEETAGQKMNKTLKIYGREFDEIKRFIDGIQYANTVTYDKKNNTPDIYLKNLARVFGWELVSSVLENDLLNTYLNPADSSFSGHSRGLTPAEAEIELWRRLLLNTPWIWKSKGTRKVVEFFFNFIGTPNGLVAFNEYIYKVKEPLDIVLFKDTLFELFEDSSLDGLNVDDEGFPRVFSDTPDLYFQKAGLWYRETGGPNSNIDILEGNNPHMGPYDGGQEYIDQFGCLIPDFSAVTIYNETISTSTTNLFINYNSGLINNATESEVFVDLVNKDNISLSDCFEITGTIIDDPKPTDEMTDCGCETGEGDESIKISIKKIDADIVSTPTPITCGYTGFTLNPEGYVIFQLPNSIETTIMTEKCCTALGFSYNGGDSESCIWMNETTLENDICNGFTPVSSDENGLVTWDNTVLQVGTQVVGAKCCSAYGYVAVEVTSGYQCYDKSSDCTSLTPDMINRRTGLITWIDTDGNITTEISPECCTALGFKSQPNGVTYECIDTSVILTQPTTLPTLSGTKFNTR